MANRSVLHAASRQKRRGRKPSARERVDEFVHTHPVGVAAATFLLGGAIGATIGATIGARIGAFNEAREERRRQQRRTMREEKYPSTQQFSTNGGGIWNPTGGPHYGCAHYKASNAPPLYTE